ncbi:hypothetical protein HYDPIDRAFT_74387, partial [Hydnomerulius pinastri MD-312]
NAEVYIVYLEDSSSLEDFDNEPWFTRGWTLQELLAPRRMSRYGKDRRPISPWAATGKVTGIFGDDIKHLSPPCSRVSE